MQCFLVGYRHATCHLYFLRIHTRLKARVYTENTSDAWHIPRYPTRKHCITSMYVYVCMQARRQGRGTMGANATPFPPPTGRKGLPEKI